MKTLILPRRQWSCPGYIQTSKIIVHAIPSAAVLSPNKTLANIVSKLLHVK